MISILLAAALQTTVADLAPDDSAELAEQMDVLQDWLAENIGTLEDIAAGFEAVEDDDPAQLGAAWSCWPRSWLSKWIYSATPFPGQPAISVLNIQLAMIFHRPEPHIPTRRAHRSRPRRRTMMPRRMTIRTNLSRNFAMTANWRPEHVRRRAAP